MDNKIKNSLRKKPWNRVNLPVWSISSKRDGIGNLNIITYVTQISMHPKRFVCGVYRNTKTLDNLLHSQQFVLQLLASNQYSLISLLGRKSGFKKDKLNSLHKKGALIEWENFNVLKNCLAVLKLSIIHHFNGGDHECFLCDATVYKNLNEGTALTLDDLRERKLIRI